MTLLVKKKAVYISYIRNKSRHFVKKTFLAKIYNFFSQQIEICLRFVAKQVKISKWAGLALRYRFLCQLFPFVHCNGNVAVYYRTKICMYIVNWWWRCRLYWLDQVWRDVEQCGEEGEQLLARALPTCTRHLLPHIHNCFKIPELWIQVSKDSRLLSLS